MTKILTFEEFVKQKRDESLEKDKNIDWQGRKDKWISSVNTLYENVTNWLLPLINQNLIEIKKSEISIFEEYLGNYQISQVSIAIGHEKILLIPKGSVIIGGFGRVDLIGKNGSMLLILTDWDNWKVAIKETKVKFIDLDKDIFTGLIKELIQ